MWARHMEIALGLWLAVSPFVFAHDPEATRLWAHDLSIAAVLVTIPLLTHRRSLRRLHLLLLPVAGWLIATGWWAMRTATEGAAPQNWIMVGLLVGMLAVIPSEASRPPRPWRS